MLNPLKLKQILGTTDDAYRIAQKNATDLLGLPPDNTALDRARALGFDVDNLLYHGSLKNINEFNPSLGEISGHLGRSVYLTDNAADASMNYANKIAPDITNKAEWKSELFDSPSLGDPEDWINKFADNDGVIYPVFAKKGNQLDLTRGSKDSIDFTPIYNDEGEFIKDNINAESLYDTLYRNQNNFDYDARDVMGDLTDAVYDDLPATDLDYFLRQNQPLSYAGDPETGDLASHEIIRRIYEDLGYDSVKINANDRFNNLMKGFDDTTHQMIFRPENVRSKFAAFDPKKLGIGAGSVISADLLANENNMNTLQRLGLLTEPENVLKEPYRNPIQQGVGMYGDLMQTPGLNFLFGDLGTGLQDISYGQPPNKDAVLDAKMSLFAGINPLANAVSKYNKFRKFIPEGKFTLDEMNAIFKDRVLSEYGDMTRMYEKLKGSQGGKVIDTDTAREMFPEYIQNRLRATDVHEGASTYSKKYYKDLLSEPTTKSVLFTAGGPAVGKSRALNKLKANDPNQIMFDTNMANYDSAVSKIDEALKQNKPVNIVYVHKSPLESFQEGALNRMLNQKSKFGSGRTVQVKDFVDIHKKSNENIRKIADHYKDNPNVRIDYVDNTDWNNPMVVDKKDIPKLDKSNKEYEQSIVSFMNKKRQEGIIDKEMYEKTLGKLLGF